MDLPGAAITRTICEKPSTTLKFIAAILCCLGGVAITYADYTGLNLSVIVRDFAAIESVASLLVLSIAQAGGGVAALVQLFAILSGEEDEMRATILAGIYSVLNLAAAILMIFYLVDYGSSMNFGCWILVITTIGATVVYIIDLVLCILHK